MDELLTSEEVETLLGGDLRELDTPGRLAAFIQQVAVTLRDAEDTRRGLQRDISRMAANRAVTGGALGTAIQALGDLTDAQQRQVFDAWGASAVEDLNAERARVRHQLIAAKAATARARKALHEAMEIPQLPDAVRAALGECVEHLTDVPDSPDAVWDTSHSMATGIRIPARSEQEVASSDSAELTIDAGGAGDDLTDLFSEADEPVNDPPAGGDQVSPTENPPELRAGEDVAGHVVDDSRDKETDTGASAGSVARSDCVESGAGYDHAVGAEAESTDENADEERDGARAPVRADELEDAAGESPARSSDDRQDSADNENSENSDNVSPAPKDHASVDPTKATGAAGVAGSAPARNAVRLDDLF